MDMKFLRSGIILPFFIFIIIGCFGFFNPETFLAVKGIFKLRDVIFIIIILIFLLNLITKKSLVIKKTPVNLIILSLILLTIFEIFYTLWLFDVSIISVVQTSRSYFYYLLFFPTLYFFIEKKELFLALKSFLFFSIIGAALIIGATIFGHSFPLPIYLESQLSTQNLSGLVVNRLYLPGATLVTMAFAIVFWLILINNQIKHKLFFIFVTIFLGIAWLFTFSRAGWIQMFVVMISPVLMVREIRKKYIKKFLLIFFIFIIIIVSSNFFIGNNSFGWDFFSKRVISIPNEIFGIEGTFGYRITESQFRFDALRDNYLLGLGFLHPKLVSDFFKAPMDPQRQALAISDWGFFNLLINFGIFGFLWFLSMIILIHKRLKKIISELDSTIYKSIAIGAFGYFWGAIISFITLGHFTEFEPITLFAVLWGIVESLYNIEKKELKEIIIG